MTEVDVYSNNYQKVMVGDLVASDDAGGIFSVKNPVAGSIIVTSIYLNVTTAPTGGSLSVDIGQANDATTSSNTYVNNATAQTAIALELVWDNALAPTTRLIANNKYITCSMASGAAAGLAGKFYISYITI